LIKFNFSAEGWHRVEHEFNDYPAGMRYLHIDCLGNGPHPQADAEYPYGLKLANCSVKALLEKNAE
jgi:hypothetical protein